MDTAWQWRSEGKLVAFAVVVGTGGSAPRAAGARLLACEDGAFFGSVSGGCVEGEVIAAAAEVMRTGKPQLLNFAAAVDGEWRAGLSCGGDIRVFVHKPPDAAIAKMRKLAAARMPITIETDTTTGKQVISAAKSAKKEVATIAGGVFVETILPARRLFIIGATHIARELLAMAAVLEMECIVIDPRAAWASAERFGDAKVLRQWGDDAFAKMRPTERDAVVALAHDEKIDDPALLAALTAKAKPAYIGALGSSRTHQKRLRRLHEQGASEVVLADIHAPVGLDIGAKTPAEIAVAIVAEMVAAFRGKDTKRTLQT
ncbi:MAG: XdhC family protein [Gammaproteobacteria bacterium]